MRSISSRRPPLKLRERRFPLEDEPPRDQCLPKLLAAAAAAISAMMGKCDSRLSISREGTAGAREKARARFYEHPGGSPRSATRPCPSLSRNMMKQRYLDNME
jgi:hypothetical protein